MHQILCQFRITTRLLFIVICPVIYALVVGGWLILQLHQEVDENRAAIGLMEMISALDQVVNSNAAERGLAMGWIATVRGKKSGSTAMPPNSIWKPCCRPILTTPALFLTCSNSCPDGIRCANKPCAMTVRAYFLPIARSIRLRWTT